MNYLKLYKFLACLLLFTNNSCHVELPETIFSLSPLTMNSDESSLLYNGMTHARYSTIPLTACFYYFISDSNLISDMQDHPYITALLLYTACHCGYYLARNYRKKIIESEEETLLQQLFHLMIIGYGIHNLITQSTKIEAKSIRFTDSQLEDFELFLQNMHKIWMHFFIECTNRRNNKSLFSYKIDRINMLEILQASSYDADIMKLMINDYETVVNTLKTKFNAYHEKLIWLQKSK